MNLVVNKRSLDRFKRRARKRYPNEYIEALWGRVDDGKYYVDNMIPMPFSDSSPSSLEFDEVSLHLLKQEAKRLKHEVLGTIHTHCGLNCLPILSQADHDSALGSGEKICGVLHLYKVDGKIYSALNWGLPTIYT